MSFIRSGWRRKGNTDVLRVVFVLLLVGKQREANGVDKLLLLSTISSEAALYCQWGGKESGKKRHSEAFLSTLLLKS